MARPKKLPGSPPPDAKTIRGAEREEISLWFKSRAEAIEAQYQERIELLRTVGEHPSPLFQKIVHMHGALGMPKRLLAKFLGITQKDLNDFYGDDYDLGTLEAISSVAANAMRIGASTTDPNAGRVAMQILDRRGEEEWRPPAQKIEDVTKRDTPPVIDSKLLTFEERAELRRMLTRVANRGTGGPLTVDEASSEPGMDMVESE